MTVLRAMLTASIAALAWSCQGSAHVVDRRPLYIPVNQLSSVVWVSTPPDEDGGHMLASAIIVGPNHLLTNAHVWAPTDPWWQGQLPAERELMLLDPKAEPGFQIHNTDGERATITLNNPIESRTFRLVASGLPDIELEEGGRPTLTSTSDQDWALIATDDPTWDPHDTARIHPEARAPDWVVSKGTELFIVGFSSIFLIDEGADDGNQSVSITRKAMVSFIESGPYTIRGLSMQTEGIHGVEYPEDWPTPLGHSGGGVYRWNEADEQLELVGVFSSMLPVKVTDWISLFGLSALTFKQEQEVNLLSYVPIARVLHALGQIDTQRDHTTSSEASDNGRHP